MKTTKPNINNLFTRGMTILLLVTIATGFGFKTIKKAKSDQNNQLVVGIGYRDEKCGNTTYTKAFCYKEQATSSDISYGKASDIIKSYLAETCNIQPNNVFLTGSYKARAVIIKYDKEVSAACRITKYAVGFGDTQIEASNDAVAKKNLDDRSSQWLTVATLFN